MKTKKFKLIIFFIFIFFVLAIILGLKQSIDNRETLLQNVIPTGYPQPTLPPIHDKIISIDKDKIIVTGERGTMNLTRDNNIVKIFKDKEKQIRASFNDLKIGQSVEIQAIVPGKEITVIME